MNPDKGLPTIIDDAGRDSVSLLMVGRMQATVKS